MSTIIKNNIQLNKKKILYYLGVFVMAAVRYLAIGLKNILPADTWWGELILGIAESGIWLLMIIVPYIFGKDEDLDRVKLERKELGVENTALKIKNEGLLVTNQLQKHLLDENKITSIGYLPDGGFAKKIEPLE